MQVHRETGNKTLICKCYYLNKQNKHTITEGEIYSETLFGVSVKEDQVT